MPSEIPAFVPGAPGGPELLILLFIFVLVVIVPLAVVVLLVLVLTGYWRGGDDRAARDPSDGGPTHRRDDDRTTRDRDDDRTADAPHSGPDPETRRRLDALEREVERLKERVDGE